MSMRSIPTPTYGVALLALAAVLFLPAHAGEKAPALALGAAMPSADVPMKNVDGRTLTLGELVGKSGTLVVFTCNHCPFAQAWEKRIAELGNTSLSRGVGVVAINSNDPVRVPDDGYEQMQKRAKALSLSFPYVVDDTQNVARAFGATRTPEAFLFDGGGKLVYHGTIDDNYEHPSEVHEHYLRDALDQLLAGEAIATSETKAVGCSIKFRG
jgi:peroxiredoxin